MYPEYDRGTRRLARHFRVEPEELLLTNGGDDALRLFFDTFVDAGAPPSSASPLFRCIATGLKSPERKSKSSATSARWNFRSKALERARLANRASSSLQSQ